MRHKAIKKVKKKFARKRTTSMADRKADCHVTREK
jgi:hypothetical protein